MYVDYAKVVQVMIDRFIQIAQNNIEEFKDTHNEESLADAIMTLLVIYCYMDKGVMRFIRKQKPLLKKYIEKFE